AQWRAIADSIGLVTCAMDPAGVRTATAQLPGLRIITPSRTACPPTVIAPSTYALRARRARAGAGSARPVRRCPRASACPCRTGGTASRSRRAAPASSNGPGTCSRRSTSPSRARNRDGYRPSSLGQDSSGLLRQNVPARDDDGRRAREVDLSREDGRSRGRSGGLAGELGARVQETHPVGDLGFAHENAIDVSTADLEGELARERRREAVGDRV